MSDSASVLQSIILAELTVVMAEIERLTGLQSQWNGRVEIEPLTSRAFGGKTFPA